MVQTLKFDRADHLPRLSVKDAKTGRMLRRRRPNAVGGLHSVSLGLIGLELETLSANPEMEIVEEEKRTYRPCTG